MANNTVADNEKQYKNALGSEGEKVFQLILPVLETKHKPSQLYLRFVMNLYLKNYKITTPEQITAFFSTMIRLVNYSEGFGFTEDELTKPGTNDRKCIFLGTTANSNVGCKINGTPKKLQHYMRFITEGFLAFLTAIPDDMKANFDENKAQMDLFAKAIRTILYFFTSKQKGNILCDTPVVKNFIEQINTIFGRNILRMSCSAADGCKYGCGRIVTSRKCKTSNKYFIMIGESDENTGTAATSSLVNFETFHESCGGRRKKTRRNQRKTKKTRKSKRRNY